MSALAAIYSQARGRPGCSCGLSADPSGNLIDASWVNDNMAYQAGQLDPDSRNVRGGFAHTEDMTDAQQRGRIRDE